MSQGPAQATSTVEQLGLGSGWLLSGKCPDPMLAPLPVPHRSAPSQVGGRARSPRQHPQHDPGGLIPAPHTLSPGKVS